MLTAIVFIITLAILIFVHELGHFLIARRNGIKAEEFGFGFPPRIIGIQFLSGKKREKIREIESIKVEKLDIKDGKQELIKETVTEEINNISKTVPVRKWRVIRGGADGDDKIEKKDLVEAEQNKYVSGTIYSLNWIPLGGFVKIKGENGDDKAKDSFAVKSAWIRIKVLAAGVIMNFFLAWLVISIAFMVGIPQAVDSSQPVQNSVIQISQVIQGSPAEKMGLMPGDQLVKCLVVGNPLCRNNFANVNDVQNFINGSKGKEISLEVKRGKENLSLKGTPRADYPSDQGPLGISLAQTAIVSYPWYQAVYEGLMTTFRIIGLILATFYDILRSLIMGQKVSVDVTGPIGIAYVAKQFTDLGFVYILQFIALLSINLGIINALPFPALDGGRILFILIEKVKGSPVSQRVEQMVHNLGFVFLILLMILITFHDVIRFGIVDKIKGIF